MNKWIIFFLCVSFLMGCKETLEKKEDKTVRLPQVEIIVLKPQKWVEKIHAYGAVEAADETSIAIDFLGKVKEVHVKEGDSVKLGQLLVEFDTKTRELQKKQAEEREKAAKSTRDEALRQLKRKQKLVWNNSISRAELDAARDVMRRAEAQHKNSLAALRLTIQRVKECKLFSPVNGIVGKRMVDKGETIIAGRTMLIIETVHKVRVVTYVTEEEINHLQVGSEASVTSRAVPGNTYIAHVESLGIKAEAGTGNFSVKLTLDNEEGWLRPGMTAQVQLKGLEIEQAILIPDHSLVDRRRRKVVYLLVEGKAVEVEPLLSVYSDDQVLIMEGLKSGDHLIVEGLSNIIDGSEVEILESKN